MADEDEELLTPKQVASLFKVDPKTVARWAKAGKLSSVRTPGNHRRFKKNEVKQLIKDQDQEDKKSNNSFKGREE